MKSFDLKYIYLYTNRYLAYLTVQLRAVCNCNLQKNRTKFQIIYLKLTQIN